MKIKKNSKVTADSCEKHNGLKVFSFMKMYIFHFFKNAILVFRKWLMMFDDVSFIRTVTADSHSI